ncbi:hypothetical protein QBC35DRAFT_542855 [Podospora australis]|uniref:Uncharacterized protein n=1 Tax=Podospora australis TaxID=1536484 RepID=A0AAN6WK70_9PEZI|nr:hypothetical protein QBC35DRAFT_542855 [Podospora australis]
MSARTVLAARNPHRLLGTEHNSETGASIISSVQISSIKTLPSDTESTTRATYHSSWQTPRYLFACVPWKETTDPWIIEQKTFAILQEFLQVESNTSAADAAIALDDLTPMKRKARGETGTEHPESFLLETWGTFIEIAKQIAHDHASQDKLVQLLQELTLLPSTEVEIWSSKTRIWADLPLIAASFREAWIEPQGIDDTYEPFEKWVNFHAFAARILGSSSSSSPGFPESCQWFHFAVWSLKDALEEEQKDSRTRALETNGRYESGRQHSELRMLPKCSSALWTAGLGGSQTTS